MLTSGQIIVICNAVMSNYITLAYHNATKALLLQTYLNSNMACSELAHYNKILDITYAAQNNGAGNMVQVSNIYHGIIDAITSLHVMPDFEDDFEDDIPTATID